MNALPFWNLRILNDKPLTTIKLDEHSPVGLHIRKKRLELQMKQGDVAKIIGVTESCIVLWENLHNKGLPMIHCFPKIIEFLGYNPVPLDTMTLSGLVKNYRMLNGLTTSGFGDLIGVDGTTVGEWEAETSYPQAANFKAVEKIVGKYRKSIRGR